MTRLAAALFLIAYVTSGMGAGTYANAWCETRPKQFEVAGGCISVAMATFLFWPMVAGMGLASAAFNLGVKGDRNAK